MAAPRLPIVLLPGLDGTGDLFEPFAAHAPPHLQPMIVRLPPLGDYAALREHVRRELPATGRFVVLGESFSGPLALAIAREQPARVAAVVLCNSFVAPPLTRLLRFAPWPLLFLLPRPRWVVRRLFVGTSASPELVSAVRAAVAKTPRAVLAARMRSVFTLPPPGASVRLAMPLLALTSANDLLVRANAAALHDVATNVVTTRIAGPHLLLQAAPRASWDAISAFVAAALFREDTES